MLAWAQVYQDGVGAPKQASERIPAERLPVLAAYGAATVARTCSRGAFMRMGRSMQANDLLEEVGKAYNQ